MDYSVIVFDTAPTGHTLRLLQFPSTLEKGLAKVMSLRNKFGGVISQMSRIFGVDTEFGEDAILGKLEGMKDIIEQVNRQFKDPGAGSGMRGSIWLEQELRTLQLSITTRNVHWSLE
ncbi:ATPase get3a [Datura stramonium]|uniref:ATPase get3a n=1 Tax=Datura stramonium TaxID=4076 RepID=A0ABS8V160_DATST|nr:ATPase get3a [Datura stramonium]